MTGHHLAQLNIARLRAPLEDPSMAEFAQNLGRINGLADTSPGFVWRLQDESGDALGLEQPFGDGIIVNLTVWTDVQSLRAFTYKSEHAAFLRRRGAWFVPLDGPHLVLWWIPAGHLPTLSEAKERLEVLSTPGPCPEAFLFARAFDAAGMPLRRGAAEAADGRAT